MNAATAFCFPLTSQLVPCLALLQQRCECSGKEPEAYIQPKLTKLTASQPRNKTATYQQGSILWNTIEYYRYTKEYRALHKKSMYSVHCTVYTSNAALCKTTTCAADAVHAIAVIPHIRDIGTGRLLPPYFDDPLFSES